MSEKPTRRVHRNWDETERLRHGQQVQQRFAREREDRFRKVQDTIEVLLAQGITISQNEVARAAGVSVGFINKHLRDVVEKAKQRQQELAGTLHTVRQLSAEAKELERLRLMNHRHREQLDELRRANKELLAQVSRVVDLEDEVELLRKQNQELLAALQASQEKVVNFPVQNTSTKKLIKTSRGGNHDYPLHQDLSWIKRVKSELSHLGISLSSTLKRKIQSKPESVVFNAILALKESLENGTVIRNPGGWLVEAIESEWVKNESLKPTSHHQLTVNCNTPQPESESELVSFEELKDLSSIFGEAND